VETWALTSDQRQRLLSLLSEIGLGIVSESRGPVPLLKFGRHVLERLEGPGASRVPLPDFADALKRVIHDMEDQKLRVMSPTVIVGVGYVYNAVDPETWPVLSGFL
jgi:hypothetical protein